MPTSAFLAVVKADDHEVLAVVLFEQRPKVFQAVTVEEDTVVDLVWAVVAMHIAVQCDRYASVQLAVILILDVTLNDLAVVKLGERSFNFRCKLCIHINHSQLLV